MGKYEALITDLDGTLVKTNINWDKLRAKVREVLKTNHPLKPLGLSVYILTRNNPKLREKAFKIIEKEELEAARKVFFDKKLYEIFTYLKFRNTKIGLVTLQNRRTALIILNRLGLTKFFRTIITRDDSLDRFVQLRIAIDKLGVKPSKTVFIGDTLWDYEAGLKMGCKTVIVGSFNELRGCDSVRSIYEIVNYF